MFIHVSGFKYFSLSVVKGHHYQVMIAAAYNYRFKHASPALHCVIRVNRVGMTLYVATAKLLVTTSLYVCLVYKLGCTSSQRNRVI